MLLFAWAALLKIIASCFSLIVVIIDFVKKVT